MNSSWIAQTFDEFGRGIGLPGLHPGAGGRLSLRLGARQHLDFQVLDEAVLLLLAGPPERSDKLTALQRALDACHVRHGWNLPVRAGLSRDGRIVFITRLAAREFRPHLVEQAFDLLNRLHERVNA